MPRIIVTIPERNAQPYRFKLDRKSISIGRGTENDIAIDSGSVSTRHAVMERVPGGYEMRDLGSTNGTKIDGYRQDKIRLRDGMHVKVGDVRVEFTLAPEERAKLSAESVDEDSPIIKEEVVKTPSTRKIVVSPKVSSEPSPAVGFFMTAVFIILGLLAFFLGMSIRYNSDNKGRSFLNELRGGESHSSPADIGAER